MKPVKWNRELITRIAYAGLGVAIGILAYALYSPIAATRTGVIVLINASALALIAALLRLRYKQRLRRELRMQEVHRTELLNMINSVAANMELEALLESLLPKLAEGSRSNWGAFYLANNATGKLEIKSSVGFSKNIYSDFDINLGEGFIGLTAMERETKIIRDIPDDTVFVTRTFLGRLKPKNLVLVPIISQDQLMGVLALASLYEYTAEQLELVNLSKFYIGAAVGNGVIYERMKRLANELQFQNKLIQDLNAELETKMTDASLFLNHIINSIKDCAIFAVDMRGHFTTWNSGAAQLYGYAASEVIGQHVSALSGMETGGESLEQQIDTVKRNGLIAETGWRTKKDGTTYCAECVMFAMYNDKGAPIGVTSICKDITAPKRAQEQLWRERELARTLLRGSAVPAAFVGGDGTIEDASDSLCKLLAVKSLAGQNFYALFKDDGGVKAFLRAGDPAGREPFKTKQGNAALALTAVTISGGESPLTARIFVQVQVP